MQCRTFWCLISGWCSPMLDSRVGIGFVEACFDFVFEFEGASSCWCWCSGWVSSVAVTSSSSSSSPHTFPSTPSSSLENWWVFVMHIHSHLNVMFGIQPVVAAAMVVVMVVNRVKAGPAPHWASSWQRTAPSAGHWHWLNRPVVSWVRSFRIEAAIRINRSAVPKSKFANWCEK